MKEKKTNEKKIPSFESFFSLAEPRIFHFIISLIANADSIEEKKENAYAFDSP